jgi:hypothetical protein
VDLTEFRGRVCDALIEIHEVCEANPPVRQQALPSDLRELLSIVRTAASELILCSSVREAIDRLKRDQLALGAVEYVSNWGLSDDEIGAAIRLAYEKRAGDTPRFTLLRFLLVSNRAMQRVRTQQRPAQNLVAPTRRLCFKSRAKGIESMALSLELTMGGGSSLFAAQAERPGR